MRDARSRRENIKQEEDLHMNTRQMFQVSPSIAKKEDKSDLMNASKRLTAALAGLVSGKARNTGQVARGKISPPRTCWRFVQATHGWFSATGRMFLFACLTALAVSFFPESAYGQRLLVGNTSQIKHCGGSKSGPRPGVHDGVEQYWLQADKCRDFCKSLHSRT